jgi:putative membrane protein
MTKLILCLALCGGSFSVYAQYKSNDTTARYFLIQASIGNLQEVAQGQVAISQATNPNVKAFAQRMVKDHSAAEAQWKQLVQARGFQIPRAATDTPVADMMLKNTPSKDFDGIYVHMMVVGHRQTLALFEKYAITGKDPDVRAWAQEMLPTLREHLTAIVALDKGMDTSRGK